MRQILIFARLTMREALRKRLAWVLLGLTLLTVVLSGFGLRALMNEGLETLTTVSLILILIMFAYSFVLALSAVFVTVPSVAGEIETGTALAVLSRPVSRSQYLLGKWLGLVLLIAAYVTVASFAEFAVVKFVTGYLPPYPVMFVGYMIAEAIVILTLALLISTRMAPIAGGVLVLGAFMLAWMGGIATAIGRELNVEALLTGGTVTQLLLPTDAMFKGATFALEPTAVVAAARAGVDEVGEFPFFSFGPPRWRSTCGPPPG